jgi:O-antigen ligase
MIFMERFWESSAPKILKGLLLAVFFIPLVVTPSTIFPFVFGKEVISRILIELALALWLVLALRDPKFRPQKSWLLGAVLIFLGIHFIAGWLGASPYRSFWSTAERMGGFVGLVHWSAFFLMLFSVFKGWPDWQKLLRLNIGVSALVSLYALFQALSLKMPWLFLSGADRVSGTLGNPTFLALYLTFTIFSAAALLVQEQSRRWQIAYSSIIIFELIIVGLTATRGAVAGFGLVLLILALWAIFKVPEPWVKKAAALFLIVFTAGALFLTLGRSWSFTQNLADNIPLVGRLIQTDFSETNVFTRIWAAQIGLEAWKARPILGWGPENYTLAFNRHFDPRFYQIQGPAWFDKAHNQPVEVLVTTGLIGFSAYLAIFGLAGFYLFRLYRSSSQRKNFYLILGAGLAAYWVQLIFLFDTPATFLQFFLFLALINGLYLEKSTKEPRAVLEKRVLGETLAKVLLAVFLGGVIFILYQFDYKPFRANQFTKLAIESERRDANKALEFYQASEKSAPVLTLLNRRHAARFVNFLIDQKEMSLEDKKRLVEFGASYVKKNLSLASDFKDWLLLSSLYINGADAIENGLEQAMTAIDGARQAGPRRRIVLRHLSMVYFLQRDYQKALETFLKLPELGDDLRGIKDQDFLATLYLNLGEFEKAIEAYQKIIKGARNNPSAWRKYSLETAKAYALMGQKSKARRAVRQAQEFNRDKNGLVIDKSFEKKLEYLLRNL